MPFILPNDTPKSFQPSFSVLLGFIHILYVCIHDKVLAKQVSVADDPFKPSSCAQRASLSLPPFLGPVASLCSELREAFKRFLKEYICQFVHISVRGGGSVGIVVCAPASAARGKGTSRFRECSCCLEHVLAAAVEGAACNFSVIPFVCDHVLVMLFGVYTSVLFIRRAHVVACCLGAQIT